MSEWKTTACILCECNCGIEVQLGGGMEVEVDGEPVALNERVIYRGFMVDGVPDARRFEDVEKWLRDRRIGLVALASVDLALWSVLITVIWQGTPFWTMTILAGCSSTGGEGAREKAAGAVASDQRLATGD